LRCENGLAEAIGHLPENKDYECPRDGNGLTEQLLAKKRELGIDTGDRSRRAVGASNAQRSAFNQENVEDAILRGILDQPLADGPLDLDLVLPRSMSSATSVLMRTTFSGGTLRTNASRDAICSADASAVLTTINTWRPPCAWAEIADARMSATSAAVARSTQGTRMKTILSRVIFTVACKFFFRNCRELRVVAAVEVTTTSLHSTV
jgi:hypothetical protein